MAKPKEFYDIKNRECDKCYIKRKRLRINNSYVMICEKSIWITL